MSVVKIDTLPAGYVFKVRPETRKEKSLSEKIHEVNRPQRTPAIENKSSFIVPAMNASISGIEAYLKKWAQEGKSFEDREVAKVKILDFLSTKNAFLRRLGVRSAYELDLSSLSLTALPRIFHIPPFSTQLTLLNLSHNMLKKLPIEIGHLTALQSLFLTLNSLEELPDQLRKLQKLKTLLLDLNELKTIPPDIFKLKNLETLSFAGNEDLALTEKELACLPPTCKVDLTDCLKTESER
jgi:hypothetical protein